MRYEPAGATDVAEEALRLLDDAGLAPRRDLSDPIDHGAWVPLSLLFPEADVPVAMVSIDPRRDRAGTIGSAGRWRRCATRTC